MSAEPKTVGQGHFERVLEIEQEQPDLTRREAFAVRAEESGGTVENVQTAFYRYARQIGSPEVKMRAPRTRRAAKTPPLRSGKNGVTLRKGMRDLAVLLRKQAAELDRMAERADEFEKAAKLVESIKARFGA